MNQEESLRKPLLDSLLFRLTLIALGPLILIGRFLIHGQVLFWGTPSLQFVPWWIEGIHQIKNGLVPLWNSLNGMGAPLLANYQTAFFYPPNSTLYLFYSISGIGGLAWGFTFLIMLHLIWAGWGMLYFLKQLGASPLAQVIGGVAFSLNGYLVSRLGFFSMIWVASWLPWIIGTLEKIIRSNEFKNEDKRFILTKVPVLAALFAFQWLAGHAQLSWYTLVLSLLWGGVRSFSEWKWRGLLKICMIFIASGFIAGLISAVQLLPTAEYLLNSQRASEYGYEEAMVYSYWPWRLLTLFAPDLFGNPGKGNFWGYASYWEDSAYMGLIPMGMALITLKGIFKRTNSFPWLSKKQITGLWFGVVVFLVLAMGQNTPVYPFLYRYVPTFNLFQAPARWMILVVFLLITLASAGIDSWRCPSGKGLYWLRLGTAGAFAITLGAGMASLVFDNIRLTFIQSTAIMGLLALLGGGLTLAMPWFEKTHRKSLWQMGVILIVGADLLWAGWYLNPVVPVSFYTELTPTETLLKEATSSGRFFVSDSTEYFLKFKRFLRFQDFRPFEPWKNLRNVLLPNTNLYNHIPSAVNFDPFVPRRYAEWMDSLNQRREDQISILLSWMGVAVWEKLDGTSPLGIRFEKISTPVQAAWFACAQNAPADVDQVMESLIEKKVLNGPLFLENYSGKQCDHENFLPLEPRILSPAKMEIITPEEGWIYFPQITYPGWQAWVDGQPQPVYRANYAFLAVYAPQAGGKVQLEYHPVSFQIGKLLSILGIVFLFLLIFYKIQPAHLHRKG